MTSATTTASDLAALMCSRLCHDMLSPVGAMSNGLELLASESDPEMRQNCIDLLEQSAKISANKLKFFRLAFGAAGGFGDRVDIDEPRELIEQLASDKGRIAINWALDAPNLSKPAVKVMLNYSQIAIDALVRGGTLDIGAEVQNGASELVLRASGPKIAFDDVLSLALSGDLDPEELTSRTAPAYMLHLIADSCGGQLQTARTEDALLLGAVLPEPEGMIG